MSLFSSNVSMGNLNCSSEIKEFFVFVNPKSELIQWNLTKIGSFCSTPQFYADCSPLMFLPNPAFQGAISPFQNGMLANYLADYNLEIHRADRYSLYPSRLNALFLLESIEDAKVYRRAHPDHVTGRILKRCVSYSQYLYSTHDAAWVDFLRIGPMMDTQTIHHITSSYWSGENAQSGVATTMGKPWIPKSVQEILFIGRVDFPDRDLKKCELDGKG